MPSWLVSTDLPADANGNRYFKPADLTRFLDQGPNWPSDVNAGGHNLTNVGLFSPTGMQVGNGSVVAPSIAFVNSATTGIFRAGADVLGITTAGDDNIFVRLPIPDIVTGTDNSGAIYFGINPSSAGQATAAIEASWGGAGNPQLGIGITRDGLKKNILMTYGGLFYIRQGTTNHFIMDSSGRTGMQAAGTIDDSIIPTTGMWYAYAPSNTTLIFRMRGADAVVRAVNLTLA